MSENTKYTERMIREFSGISGYVHKVLEDVIIEDEDIERIFSVENKGLCFVSSHRSHLDYLILGTRLVEMGCQKIRFAAGDNLTRFPLLGKKFRSLGAFSVYREKANQRSYLFKLADFVKKIILKGQNLAVYPEGGRSYTGRMLEMKTGLTGAAVMAQQENPEKDYYYIPVACSYSIIPEARYFPLLLKGRRLRDKGKNLFERTLGMLLYFGSDLFAFLKIWLLPNRDSYVFIDVGNPIKVNDMTDVQGKYREKSKNQFFANGAAIKDCSDKIYNAILKLYRIMPHNIVAYLLLKKNYSSDTRHALIEDIISEMQTSEFNMKSVQGRKVDEIVREGVKLLRANGVVAGSMKNPRVRNEFLLDYFAGPVKDLKREP